MHIDRSTSRQPRCSGMRNYRRSATAACARSKPTSLPGKTTFDIIRGCYPHLSSTRKPSSKISKCRKNNKLINNLIDIYIYIHIRVRFLERYFEEKNGSWRSVGRAKARGTSMNGERNAEDVGEVGNRSVDEWEASPCHSFNPFPRLAPSLLDFAASPFRTTSLPPTQPRRDTHNRLPPPPTYFQRATNSFPFKPASSGSGPVLYLSSPPRDSKFR